MTDEELAELANLRIDKSALDMQVDSLTDQNDHLRDLLEYERERLATLRIALARAEATAEQAGEALEAQGAVVEALNRENARLCADLLAVEGQEAEVRVEWGFRYDADDDTVVHGGYSEGSARRRAEQYGTLYRRTVTTSPWVEVPAEPEGDDYAR